MCKPAQPLPLYTTLIINNIELYYQCYNMTFLVSTNNCNTSSNAMRKVELAIFQHEPFKE